jgi:hypothetical protein
MVVIVAPLKLYRFTPLSLLRRKKIANPKSVIPACFERESRRIRILTGMSFRQNVLNEAQRLNVWNGSLPSVISESF